MKAMTLSFPHSTRLLCAKHLKVNLRKSLLQPEITRSEFTPPDVTNFTAKVEVPSADREIKNTIVPIPVLQTIATRRHA